ncbi:hypothetical protein EDC48_101379 [Gibbsiella quercinecans]|nr:hypothetical protein EDC48_101379 [Gibbsiella quercinecans]
MTVCHRYPIRSAGFDIAASVESLQQSLVPNGDDYHGRSVWLADCQEVAA